MMPKKLKPKFSKKGAKASKQLRPKSAKRQTQNIMIPQAQSQEELLQLQQQQLLEMI